jgi:hypothetical protein
MQNAWKKPFNDVERFLCHVSEALKAAAAQSVLTPATGPRERLAALCLIDRMPPRYRAHLGNESIGHARLIARLSRVRGVPSARPRNF